MFGSGAKGLRCVKCIILVNRPVLLSLSKVDSGSKETLLCFSRNFPRDRLALQHWHKEKGKWQTEKDVKSRVSARTARRQTIPSQAYHYYLSHKIKTQSVEQETGSSSTERTRKTHWFRLSVKEFSWQPRFPQSFLQEDGRPPMRCSCCLPNGATLEHLPGVCYLSSTCLCRLLLNF